MCLLNCLRSKNSLKQGKGFEVLKLAAEPMVLEYFNKKVVHKVMEVMEFEELKRVQTLIHCVEHNHVKDNLPDVHRALRMFHVLIGFCSRNIRRSFQSRGRDRPNRFSGGNRNASNSSAVNGPTVNGKLHCTYKCN